MPPAGCSSSPSPGLVQALLSSPYAQGRPHLLILYSSVPWLCSSCPECDHRSGPPEGGFLQEGLRPIPGRSWLGLGCLSWTPTQSSPQAQSSAGTPGKQGLGRKAFPNGRLQPLPSSRVASRVGVSWCFGGREREGGPDTFLLCGIGVQVSGDRANTALSHQPAGAGGKGQGAGGGCCIPRHRMLTCPAEPRSFQPRERPPRLPLGGDPATAGGGRGGQTVFNSAPRALGVWAGCGLREERCLPWGQGVGAG